MFSRYGNLWFWLQSDSTKVRVIECLRIDWLLEEYYLRSFLRLSRIPHLTTLQKFTDRIKNSLLERIISSFIVISGTKHIFVG